MSRHVRRGRVPEPQRNYYLKCVVYELRATDRDMYGVVTRHSPQKSKENGDYENTKPFKHATIKVIGKLQRAYAKKYRAET